MHKAYMIINYSKERPKELSNMLQKCIALTLDIPLGSIPHPNYIQSSILLKSMYQQHHDKMDYIRMGRPLIHNESYTLYYPFLFNLFSKWDQENHSTINIEESFQLKLLSTVIFNDKIEEIISFFQNDRKHGASQLAQICLDSLSECTDTETAYNLAYQLSYIRPSMIPIKNAAISVVNELHQKRGEISISKVCKDIAVKWKMENDEIIPNNAKAVLQSMVKVGEKLKIFTMSYSSSILKVITFCKDIIGDVIIAESRPLFEGVTLAKNIHEIAPNIKITLITDVQMAIFIPDCNVVLLGADTINIDKQLFTNKTGSFAACLISNNFKVPIYVISHENKFEHDKDEYIWSKINEIPAKELIFMKQRKETYLEEMSKEEVMKDWKQSEQEFGSNVDVRNIYFEQIPFHLITAIISNVKVYDNNDLRSRL